jgi:hypothetical protein
MDQLQQLDLSLNPGLSYDSMVLAQLSQLQHINLSGTAPGAATRPWVNNSCTDCDL